MKKTVEEELRIVADALRDAGFEIVISEGDKEQMEGGWPADFAVIKDGVGIPLRVYAQYQLRKDRNKSDVKITRHTLRRKDDDPD